MNFLSSKWLLAFIICIFNLSSFAAIQPTIDKELADLEASSGGRIGVYAINTANNSQLQYRAEERFPTGCTSKVIGVANLLAKSMKDKTLLAQKINYNQKDLINWSPITEKHLSSGMTIEQLCAASISYSDNTAMNLLVKKMGGLKAMNRFARSIGNESFQQDNGWPEEAFSGGRNNFKDSAKPKDMAESLQKLTLGDTLAKPQQEKLINWLKANTTGDKRIRAGVPKDWVVGDKTGTGASYGTSNDLGIIWPPNCAPIVLAIYYTSDDKQAQKRDDIVASITRLMINKFALNDPCLGKQ